MENLYSGSSTISLLFCMYMYMYCVTVTMAMVLFADGEPGDSVRLFSDGPDPQRRETVHSQHLQEDQEGRLQRAAHPEVHSQVCVFKSVCVCVCSP